MELQLRAPVSGAGGRPVKRPDRSGALHYPAPIRVADGPAFAACGAYSTRVVDDGDWDSVTCGLCKRRRVSIERRAAALHKRLDAVSRRRTGDQ